MHLAKKLLASTMIVTIVMLFSSCTKQTATLSDPLFNTNEIQAKADVNLGVHYLITKNIQEAKLLINQSLQEDPNIPSPWYAMGYYLENTGQRQEAETYYKKAIAIAPESGETYNNYGTYLCRGGLYQQCLEQFQKAIKTNYNDVATAYQNAGLALINMNKEYEAKYYLINALESDPKRTTSMLELARIYYDENKPDQARHYMNMYLKAGGNKDSEEQTIYNEVEFNKKPNIPDLPNPRTTHVS